MSLFRDRRPFYGQDPHVTKVGCEYLLCESYNESLIKVSTLTSLAPPERGGSITVWHDPTEQQVWAPELHQIDGHWYIYYAASDGNNKNHRMYVVGAAADPFGNYLFKEVLHDVWGIDMTTFTWDGKRFAVWSGWAYNGAEFPQNLYIAELLSPVEIGPRILLAEPEFSWEKSIAPILEGPQVWQQNGDLILLYSANASWTVEYATGALVLEVGGNPLNRENWVKRPTPLLTNAGHGMVIDDLFIHHRKMSSLAGWTDREIVALPAGSLL